MEYSKEENNLRVIRPVEELLSKDEILERIRYRNYEKTLLDDKNAEDELLLVECEKLGIKTESELIEYK